MKILGLSAFYHDSAAVLLDKGEIIAAAQEERFSRKKHDPAFPIQSIEFCLKAEKPFFLYMGSACSRRCRRRFRRRLLCMASILKKTCCEKDSGFHERGFAWP